eukprot:11088959-Alexandrium_andersonii.AAC.1
MGRRGGLGGPMGVLDPRVWMPPSPTTSLTARGARVRTGRAGRRVTISGPPSPIGASGARSPVVTARAQGGEVS